MMSPALIRLLDNWVREAVALHGDDWSAIMASVEQKIAYLGEAQRCELAQQITLILAPGADFSDISPN